MFEKIKSWFTKKDLRTTEQQIQELQTLREELLAKQLELHKQLDKETTKE
jgi:SET domain-containing protein